MMMVWHNKAQAPFPTKLGLHACIIEWARYLD